MALLGARRGLRVLVIGLIDTLGLSEHLGAEQLDYEPRRVHPGVFSLAVDRPSALDEYLKLQLRVPRAAPTKQLTKALNVLVETAPGIREIISIGKPLFEVWRGTWDLVIVDAPPVGQLGSYLRAPATISQLVPAGGIRDQAERMRRSLTDPVRSGLVLVATPEELPVTETTQAIADLEAEELVGGHVVVANRVVPDAGLAPADISRLPPGPWHDAAVLHAGVHTAQQQWLEVLPHHGRLPYLFGLLTPGEVAARLADHLEEIFP